MPLTGSKFLQRIRDIRVWKRAGERAPHKALMLLLMLGRLRQGQEPVLDFLQMRASFRKLLEAFGPSRSRRNDNAHRPFELLAKDDLWWVEDLENLGRSSANDHLLIADLTRRNPRAGLSCEVVELLQREPRRIDQAALMLLHREFPETCHQSILTEVGFDEVLSEVGESAQAYSDDLDLVWMPLRPRQTLFRREVLAAYGNRCALCGYDVHVDGDPVGIEAAHIRWHCKKGPDKVCNGMALCAVHHYALDRGDISLADDLKVLVSDRLGGDYREEFFTRFRGERLCHLPDTAEHRPSAIFLEWHRDEVYRSPL